MYKVCAVVFSERSGHAGLTFSLALILYMSQHFYQKGFNRQFHLICIGLMLFSVFISMGFTDELSMVTEMYEVS